MRFIEITNIERDLFKPTKITFVGRENRMFVSERLFLAVVGSNMDNRFILFEDELPEVQEHYMDTYNTFYSL